MEKVQPKKFAAKPSHSRKGKQEKGKEHLVDTWNKVTYDKYDPDLAKKQADMQKKEKHIDKEGKREKDDLKGDVEPKNSDKSGSSLGDIFGTGDDSGNRVDASKRFYESKTGFWTSLYHDSKGRTDVVSKKSTSTEFRLTDLGLDKKFALSDLSQKEIPLRILR